MSSLIFLQIISPWHRRSFWALLRRSHLGPEHTMFLTQFLPTHANPRAATRVLTWALKRGWTSPARWHVPASRNLSGVHEWSSDPCAESLYCFYSAVKTWDSLSRSLKRVGGNFWELWEEGDTLTCVTADPVGLLLAAISGGHHVPPSQGSGSAMGWDCGWSLSPRPTAAAC